MCRCRCAASMAFTRACVECRSPSALSGSAARSDGRCSRSAHISCTVAGSVRERSSRLSSGNTEDSGQSCASRRNSSTRKARQRRIRSESSRPLGKKEGEEDACQIRVIRVIRVRVIRVILGLLGLLRGYFRVTWIGAWLPGLPGNLWSPPRLLRPPEVTGGRRGFPPFEIPTELVDIELKICEFMHNQADCYHGAESLALLVFFACPVSSFRCSGLLLVSLQSARRVQRSAIPSATGSEPPFGAVRSRPRPTAVRLTRAHLGVISSASSSSPPPPSPNPNPPNPDPLPLLCCSLSLLSRSLPAVCRPSSAFLPGTEACCLPSCRCRRGCCWRSANQRRQASGWERHCAVLAAAAAGCATASAHSSHRQMSSAAALPLPLSAIPLAV